MGVNRFQIKEASEGSLLKVDPRLEDEQIERLQAFRSQQDRVRVKEHLDALQNAAAGKDNLMPLIVSAVSDGCTLGEISHAFRAVFGVHRETMVL